MIMLNLSLHNGEHVQHYTSHDDGTIQERIYVS